MKLKALLFFLLCLVLDNYGGFAWYSPAIGIAFIINFFVILLILYKAPVVIEKRAIYVSLLVLFILFISVQSANGFFDILRSWGRSLYIFAGLALATFLPMKGCKAISVIFLGVVLIDGFYRLMIGNVYDWYSLKKGLVFVDTNFIGLIFVSFLIPLVKNLPKVNLSIYLTLLLSFLSRTALLAFLFSILFKRLLLLALVMSISIFSYFSFVEIESLPKILQDGSLITKFAILKTSIIIMQLEPYSILFGFGKTGIVEAIQNILTNQITYTDSSPLTVGHTLFGLVLELGILYILAIIYLVNMFIVSGYKIIFWTMMFFAGFIGLFPLSYLGICVFLFNNSIYINAEREFYKKND